MDLLEDSVSNYQV